MIDPSMISKAICWATKTAGKIKGVQVVDTSAAGEELSRRLTEPGAESFAIEVELDGRKIWLAGVGPSGSREALGL